MPHKPVRLPPLKVLRVRNPNKTETNACVTVLASVLACWASAGYNSAGCQNIEMSLRGCMDAPPAPAPPTNTINYHLRRLSGKLISQAKKGK
ncbi:hypothetical protein B0T26DRAFT_651468 [Lasiosphaeria miniovina]|uniref:Small ribosomal subunit protein mS37 n=1 Tax=Lasiosphaeria miniovina TaxID=1954250 RepID=A0AA40DU01_9PEZI|nr:uncharacterized protein B0T26DRAFT_651468 [Lasiosphaeria miniovina]KAK0713287.1 hypothetical protein B0T26DRAFT_651468 [Lasiosphaeria miniovina]